MTSCWFEHITCTMGKRYYCDYCDRSFQDNMHNRKKHLNGVQHHRAKKAWFDHFRGEPCSWYLDLWDVVIVKNKVHVISLWHDVLLYYNLLFRIESLKWEIYKGLIGELSLLTFCYAVLAAHVFTMMEDYINNRGRTLLFPFYRRFSHSVWWASKETLQEVSTKR